MKSGVGAILILLLLAIASSPATARQGVACSNFASQSEAQAAFVADPAALGELDYDGDGVACEPAVNDSRKSPPRDPTVTKVFELTLGGQPRIREELVAGARVTDAETGEELVTVAFCWLPGLLPCTAGGTLYREGVKFERGSRVTVEFVLNGGPFVGPELLSRATETLDSDRRNSASYAFGIRADGRRQRDQIPRMPQSGAGATAPAASPGHSLSTGPVVAIYSLLFFAVGGYAALESRRFRH